MTAHEQFSRPGGQEGIKIQADEEKGERKLES